MTTVKYVSHPHYHILQIDEAKNKRTIDTTLFLNKGTYHIEKVYSRQPNWYYGSTLEIVLRTQRRQNNPMLVDKFIIHRRETKKNGQLREKTTIKSTYRYDDQDNLIFYEDTQGNWYDKNYLSQPFIYDQELYAGYMHTYYHLIYYSMLFEIETPEMLAIHKTALVQINRFWGGL